MKYMYTNVHTPDDILIIARLYSGVMAKNPN